MCGCGGVMIVSDVINGGCWGGDSGGNGACGGGGF